MNIKTGVIKKPPPMPNSPAMNPTMKLSSKITKILTWTCATGRKKSIQFYYSLTQTLSIHIYLLDYIFVSNYTAIGYFMTKKCELTGKRPLKGHNVSHANNKTKRKVNPGIKKIKFKSDILKRNIALKVSNAALRTVDFKGGIDKFLKSAKVFKLSKRAKKYRSKIVLKEA